MEKITLPLHIMKQINSISLKVPERCQYCKTILGVKLNSKWEAKGYCSEWCYEMEHLPEIKHTCLMCGIVVPFYKRKNGKGNAGVYPKFCSDCNTIIRNRGKNEKVCFKCGVIKEKYNFDINPKTRLRFNVCHNCMGRKNKL